MTDPNSIQDGVFNTSIDPDAINMAPFHPLAPATLTFPNGTIVDIHSSDQQWVRNALIDEGIIAETPDAE